MAEVPILPEQVPIDIAALADLKTALEKASESRDQISALSVTFSRVFKSLSDASDVGVLLEDTVNDKARQILATHNVKAEDFVRFDLDKGVIVIKGK